jgi:5-methyltetrahydropteroyltriglutamate--homocysteine methyltransferase
LLSTTVGNYPRVALEPGGASVRRAWTRLDREQASIEDVQGEEDLFTIEALKEQADAGIDMVTDGQIRWADAQTYWARGIEGFEITGLIRWFDTNTYYRQPVLKSAPKWTKPIAARDLEYAESYTDRPLKAVITGPYTLAKLSIDEHFGDLRAFTLAVAEVLNQEAKALEAVGPAIIQFDEPAIVRPGNEGDQALFEEAMRVVTSGLSAKTALYTYFGGVDGLNTTTLFALPFDVIGLDFWMGPENWDALPSFPHDKELGLGIIDARNTKLESVDAILEGVKRASAHVSPDRIHVNPSCGLEFLPRDRARAKLLRLGEATTRAREVLS